MSNSNHAFSLSKIKSVVNLRAQLIKQYPSFNLKKLSKILILGAAEEGGRLNALCQSNNIEVVSWVDDNPKRVNGRTILSSKVLRKFDRNIPVVIASHRILGATKFLKKIGFKNIAPFALLQILYPKRFPPHMFYRNWLEDLVTNKNQYKKIFSLLNDSKSRRVLNKLIQFRLTLDPLLMEPVIDNDLYRPRGIMSFDRDEVYIDGGSYDGDSVRSFIKKVGGKYEKILAFEPDKIIYQKLRKKMVSNRRILCFNKGLFDKNKIMSFSTTANRASLIDTKGGSSISVASIDSVLKGKKVSFIKMNIEGAEINALKGTKQSIRLWHPKMAISCYHKPSDLWKIPLLIKKMEKKYNLYLRQHDGGVIESVCYATYQND